LIKDFEKSGFDVVVIRGVVFKILSDFQLNRMMQAGIIGPEHVHGLQGMAKEYGEFGDSIFIVAKRTSGSEQW
jgi:hypothetical protein